MCSFHLCARRTVSKIVILFSLKRSFIDDVAAACSFQAVFSVYLFLTSVAHVIDAMETEAAMLSVGSCQPSDVDMDANIFLRTVFRVANLQTLLHARRAAAVARCVSS